MEGVEGEGEGEGELSVKEEYTPELRSKLLM